MPKAACTSVLWTLAELVGMTAEDFEGSTLPEPSASLTVHDMNAWAPDHRLAQYEGEARRRILGDDDWLRFTVVRDPWHRLWSGWLSKLLLREPRFVALYGEQPWFPRLPERAGDVVEDFRRFVAALGAGEAEDVHWAVQHDLSSQLPLTHVGRAERLGDTLRLLYDHVGTEPPAPAGRRNASPLALPPDAYDAGGGRDRAPLLRRRLRGVRLRRPAAGGRLAGRLGGRGGRRAPAAARDDRPARAHRDSCTGSRSAAPSACRTPRRGSPRGRRDRRSIGNLEGHADFNVRWGWDEGPLRPGLTAIVRVKNEARALPWTLPPLLRAVDRVTLIDNGSTDGTARVAREVADGLGAELELASYPFAVARCGAEHLSTPETSVHSLAYFYNWSFAHVRTTYALKWDGDMVLSDLAAAALRDLAWQLEAAELVVRVPRLGLYVADDRLAYVDTALRNCEPWAWPNRPGFRFVKALEWELPMFPPGIESVTLPEFSCVELKFLDGDEFGHWSPTDFDASPRTARKRREQAVFRALAAGEPPPERRRRDRGAGGHARDRPRAARCGFPLSGSRLRRTTGAARARARAAPARRAARVTARGCPARRDRATGRRARPRPRRTRRTCSARCARP